MRLLVLIYGVICYAIFFATFLYAIGFVANVAVPKSIDSGPAADLTTSLLIDAALLGLFAAQHSVMARAAFKSWWTRIVPPAAERSTYVLLSSLALLLLFWQWRPLARPIWEAESDVAQAVLWGAAAFGWLLVLVSTFQIDHFDLFGLRQVYLDFTRQPYRPVAFRTSGLHKLVRHPIMLGFIIAFWATPTMTVGHLFFTAVTTAYVLIALQLEERDLVTFHGEQYREYQRDVRMLVPLPKRRRP